MLRSFSDKQGEKVASDSCKSEEQKEESDSKGKGSCDGNWLVRLAKALAEVQNSFLSKAMENQETMQNNLPDEKTTEGMSAQEKDDYKAQEQEKRKEFISAQSEFSANMQLFNQTATMTATTIKTLGEALAAISRKQ
jgi:hypothetical protein